MYVDVKMGVRVAEGAARPRAPARRRPPPRVFCTHNVLFLDSCRKQMGACVWTYGVEGTARCRPLTALRVFAHTPSWLCVHAENRWVHVCRRTPVCAGFVTHGDR